MKETDLNCSQSKKINRQKMKEKTFFQIHVGGAIFTFIIVTIGLGVWGYSIYAGTRWCPCHRLVLFFSMIKFLRF